MPFFASIVNERIKSVVFHYLGNETGLTSLFAEVRTFEGRLMVPTIGSDEYTDLLALPVAKEYYWRRKR